MRRPRSIARRRSARRRGQATIEGVLVMSLLFIVFSMVIYVCYLGIAKLVGYHAAFVTARSHVVGFEPAIVYRSMEVGSIGMAGRPTSPTYMENLSPLELSAREPALIEEFMTSDGYPMYYKHWETTYANLPLSENDGTVTIRVWTHDYTMGDDDHPMPLNLHELKADINRDNWVRMYNHAAFYLE